MASLSFFCTPNRTLFRTIFERFGVDMGSPIAQRKYASSIIPFRLNFSRSLLFIKELHKRKDTGLAKQHNIKTITMNKSTIHYSLILLFSLIFISYDAFGQEINKLPKVSNEVYQSIYQLI